MQVVYHLGAPRTDEDQLIKSLLKNRGLLAKEGVIVPPPSRYRTVIRDTTRLLEGAPAPEDIQDALLDTIIDDEEADRLILSFDKFICINRLVAQGAQIWPMIDRKGLQLRNLFPQAQVEFFIGMRDPATLIPALFQSSRFDDFGEFTENMQPHALAWSEMLVRLRLAHPDIEVTVWCNEDTPLIWGEIMRQMADCDPTTTLDGVDDLLSSIMYPAGFQRMQTYLTEHPPETEVQRRRIVSAFLDKYARLDAIEEELDVPGWSQEMVENMTEAYEEDMAVVARIPGVNFITP
jgi:hypothetical protein